jgi:hypothetical protein
MITKARVLIIALLLILIYFGAAIVRLENYHYAVHVGLCADVEVTQRDRCLNKIQSRTNHFWHLMYGLGIF